MFKNATIYRIALPDVPADAIDRALACQPFVPCTPGQASSIGWVPPRGEEHGAMLEAVAGHWIARLMTETKTVPADVLRRRVDAACKQIEAQTGRRPGKKERKNISDDMMLAMLPQAFPRQAAVGVWIDHARGLMVIDTSSQDTAALVAGAFVEAVPGAQISMLATTTSPAGLMTAWLLDDGILDTDDRHGFDVGRACELRATDESASVVRYKNHGLDIPEVREHIQQGKVPVRLALTYGDRVAATLTADMVLAGIEFLDVVTESRGDDAGFDADVAIAAGELRALIDDLVAALGGIADSK